MASLLEEVGKQLICVLALGFGIAVVNIWNPVGRRKVPEFTRAESFVAHPPVLVSVIKFAGLLGRRKVI